MIDHYIWGEVRRISPEAPVPVLSVKREFSTLGGASNVVNNLLCLGCKVDVVGVTGKDLPGSNLLKMVSKKGGSLEGIVISPDVHTTIKTRVIAQNQQIVRVDYDMENPVSLELQKSLIERVVKILPQCDALIIEDYGKGVITPALLKEVIKDAKKKGLFISVDPKVYYDEYKGISIMTPNHHEAGSFTGITINNTESLLKASKQLLDQIPDSSLLITRGSEGMSLFEADGNVLHIPAQAREVFDVSGAGDTVIAVLTAFKAAGISVQDAAQVSNLAAGVVVGKLGTHPCYPDEIIRYYESVYGQQ